jgi:hypothetical protein
MSIELRCTRPIKVKQRRQACNELANEYEVLGKGYSARAVLCVKHKLLAEKEGFVLKAVEPAK